MNLMRVTNSFLRSSFAQIKWKPIARGAVYLDEDWCPGPYPKTEAERLAAAKKYNLLPIEYEPYDPERWEWGWGDYPHLPNLCFHDKNPEQAWDYQCHHHNYGEVWHVHANAYMNYMPAQNHKAELPWYKVVQYYSVVFIVVYGICELFHRYERVTIFKPAHLVDPGVKHYHYPNSKLEFY